MDRSLYVAMSGAKQILLAQASNANNLANANTPGFRADFEQLRSMPVFGNGYPSRVYAMTERPGVDLSTGSLQTTGRDLDVAINGDGWLAVQAKDGSEAYTRAGDLHITPAGQLVTGSGLPVLGNAGPIAIPPAQKVEIGSDGTISIIPQGANATALAILDRIKLVKPEKSQLEKGEDGLMRIKDGTPVEATNEVQLVTGSLEGSNVSTVEEMVQMIELAREFEYQIKMMKTVEDDGNASAELMRIG
ncbi:MULTISPECIES: flagellar basal-body rod protein FlgF [Methylocaldum]|jgi:flagellar basal-body rod protein FlgF|uniref:flagellar basal-body rod protein FlgF n=1 Tax=unclassified Methylocaldum TaxID=2622260 RepID=UPI000989BC05|nr:MULTISPECIES: flagellar basal-body rod protein FlgF [unclassified Methylocaldum]MBP1151002.1 flagellar basal-body rod protein FlgF [Methylocaldum sp. RMAD-M]MDV3241545.1 flagellar basal-body rod protein FlgF [Methylocaldum sp.]MVF21667.1 flagellar basal-body rod protein FlgF [Methylocaldum sp. BRCS4]